MDGPLLPPHLEGREAPDTPRSQAESHLGGVPVRKAWRHSAAGAAGRHNTGVARQDRTPYQDCLAEARRLAAAGKGMEAAAAHRIQSIAQIILAAEAARAAEEELADTVRAAAVCDITVAELAAASGKPRSWVRRTADS